MPCSIEDLLVDFYSALFDGIFSEPFRTRIEPRLIRHAVMRQVQDSAGAASQSLTRLFLNEQPSQEHVADVLRGFSALRNRLHLDAIAHPNETPENIVEARMVDMPGPEVVRHAGHEPV